MLRIDIRRSFVVLILSLLVVGFYSLGLSGESYAGGNNGTTFASGYSDNRSSGAKKKIVDLQKDTPGYIQEGNINISGTALVGKSVGIDRVELGGEGTISINDSSNNNIVNILGDHDFGIIEVFGSYVGGSPTGTITLDGLTGGISITGDVAAGGNLSVAGDVALGQSVAVGKSLSVGSNVVAGGNLSVGSVAADGNLSVDGDAAVSGDITAANVYASNLVYASSDVRLKENIHTIENALDMVTKLRGVDYEWIDKKSRGEGRRVGLIAQEIEKIVPEVVTQNDEGIKSVAYSPLIGILIEAIKELKAENNLLTNKLTAFESRQSAIEDMLIVIATDIPKENLVNFEQAMSNEILNTVH